MAPNHRRKHSECDTRRVARAEEIVARFFEESETTNEAIHDFGAITRVAHARHSILRTAKTFSRILNPQRKGLERC
jgi:hypothetical protein